MSDNEKILAPENDNKPLNPWQRQDRDIIKRVAKGDYGAILEAFPVWHRPTVTEELLRLDRIMDNLGPEVGQSVLVREASTSSAFPYLLGADLHRRLITEYQAFPAIWQEWCSTASFEDFKTQYGIRLSEMPDMERVYEAAEYPEVAPSEVRWNYTGMKFGSKFAVTWEATVNDDLKGINQWVTAMGRSATRILNSRSTKMLSNNAATTYDSVTLAHASSHGANLVTTALTEAYLEAGIEAMAKQTDTKSNPLFIRPSILMVPPALEMEANRMVRSPMLITGNTTPQGNVNPIANFNLRPLVNPYITDVDSWYLLAASGVYPTIQMAFLNGNQEPELFRSNAGNPLDFNRDVMEWKVRFVFGECAVDHVGLFAAVP